jgi:hypothetical protein
MASTSRWMGCVLVLMTACLLTAGCTVGTGKGGAKKRVGGPSKAHDHAEQGPHGGALAEWGEEKYHAEFTVDHPKKQATVYILDGTAKKPSPIPAETITLTLTNVKPTVQFTLKADPQEGDPKGSSSRFIGTHDQLGVEMEYEGEISGRVGDTPYVGAFEEKEHHKKDEKKK